MESELFIVDVSDNPDGKHHTDMRCNLARPK
jgi:hypothetical protein